MIEPRLLTRAEAAAYLRVALRTFQRLAITYVKIRGLKRYDREDLDRWLEKQKVSTSDGETASPTLDSRTKVALSLSRRANEIQRARQRKRRASTTVLFVGKDGRE